MPVESQSRPVVISTAAIIIGGDQEDEEDEADQTIGKCIYYVVVIMAIVAFCCGIYANVYCNFVEREVTFQNDFNLTDACASLRLNSSQHEEMCNTLLDKHGVGFYSWMGTVPENEQVCFSYTVWNPTLPGWITPEFDSKFNAASAMAICANVFGAIAVSAFLISYCCCPISQGRLRLMGNYFYLACLFQGLSLLIFKSDICEESFLDQYFPNGPFDEDIVESVKCVLGPGSRMAITACIFYFMCMNLVQKAIAPTSLTYGYKE